MDYTQQDVEDNMGLVHFVAHKLSHKMEDDLVSYEDLVSDGILGLIHALERFDLSKGFKFSPYGYKCIWGYIMRGNRSFYQERWRFLSSRRTGDTLPYTFSIHDEVGHAHHSQGGTWEEVISNNDALDRDPKEDDSEEVNPTLLRQRMMEPLNARQQKLLGAVLDNNLSQTETAKQFGVSRQAIHMQWMKIRKKLREAIDPDMLAELA